MRNMKMILLKRLKPMLRMVKLKMKERKKKNPIENYIHTTGTCYQIILMIIDEFHYHPKR